MPIPLSPSRLVRLPIGVAYGATDIGPVRQGNEDNFLIDEALGLAMVADGMGGHAAGEVASAGALTELRAYLARHAAGLTRAPAPAAPPDPDTTWSDPAAGAVRLLHAAIEHTNASLYAQNCARGRLDGGGMGATLTGFWRAPGANAPLVAFHVGDSRLYRWRAGLLEQLTRDQTLYQQALEAGMLDHLPARNLLLQAMGPSASVTPEVRAHRVEPGDVLMLCSDGLHGSVPHGEIEALLAGAHGGNLDAVCARLIEMATAYGGRDNITVLAALCVHS
ncbi:PP2C family protein-serine/threonine phosphatase [Massilia sp. S19_KUP03_FR1]|uniref:PP2C family protein-serine/threonine phosphatase n=1 Tax=Massilia sp. S19_KUP03_FR1 TaxID=3025503 RepID=UPI002FCDBF23